MGSHHPRGLILHGPFLTRREVALRTGMSPAELRTHPGLLRLGGRIVLQEAYAGFQFDAHGIRDDLAAVVEAFSATADPWEVCDWLTRANAALGGKSPLAFLDEGGALHRVIGAAHS
jgi:hypothetical protein